MSDFYCDGYSRESKEKINELGAAAEKIKKLRDAFDAGFLYDEDISADIIGTLDDMLSDLAFYAQIERDRDKEVAF